MKYRVKFKLDEEVEANNFREAFKLALCKALNTGFIENEVSKQMYWESDIEEISDIVSEWEG